jgi:hypothetical protein
LPAIVLLPAAAICADTSESLRFALRATVVVAILQVLVAYPVAGSQVGWATVAMVVPCAIALAAGIDRFSVWRDSGRLVRGVATAVLCLVLVIASGVWPPDVWSTYHDNTKLALPGAGLMRIEAQDAAKVHAVVKQLRAHCDTFYGVPNQNSFHIFTGLPAVTGMVANGGPAGLTQGQQQQVVDALRAQFAAGKRVCILRNGFQKVPAPGPLTRELKKYRAVVAKVKNYTIARRK